eukprot:SAG22_NODE_1732_length_3700_cov_2.112746_5_plen_101_part_00
MDHPKSAVEWRASLRPSIPTPEWFFVILLSWFMFYGVALVSAHYNAMLARRLSLVSVSVLVLDLVFKPDYLFLVLSTCSHAWRRDDDLAPLDHHCQFGCV